MDLLIIRVCFCPLINRLCSCLLCHNNILLWMFQDKNYNGCKRGPKWGKLDWFLYLSLYNIFPHLRFWVMESSFFLFFLNKMYILVGKQQTYDNITGFILGVTPPEYYFYPRVPSENYRLLDSFTVNNKELKLT